MKHILHLAAGLVITFIFVTGTSSCTTNETAANDTLQVSDTPTVDLIGDLNKKIAADPNNASLYHERAYIYLRLGDFEKAMNDANRSISLDPDFAGYYYTKGEIFFAEYKADSAKAQYEKALSLKPDYWDAELKIGKMYMYLKNWEIAIKHINNALKIEPSIPEAYFMKGEIYEELGDSSKAASSFQTATEQNPDYYEAYIRLGLLYAGARNMLALDYYNTALTLRPESVEALYNKAIFCQNNGLYDQALATYDKILAIKNEFEIVHHNKGYIFLVYLNQPETAIDHFNAALQINPKYVSAYHNRGLAHEELKAYSKAREDYQKALSIDPQFDLSAEALDNLDRKGLR
jgi:tetratricopeptide (TPR) repeat protein